MLINKLYSTIYWAVTCITALKLGCILNAQNLQQRRPVVFEGSFVESCVSVDVTLRGTENDCTLPKCGSTLKRLAFQSWHDPGVKNKYVRRVYTACAVTDGSDQKSARAGDVTQKAERCGWNASLVSTSIQELQLWPPCCWQSRRNMCHAGHNAHRNRNRAPTGQIQFFNLIWVTFKALITVLKLDIYWIELPSIVRIIQLYFSYL